jgi:hypothetical protein
VRLATREKEVRNLFPTGAYRAGLKARIEAFEDYAASPWFKKGFKRART